MSRYSVVAHGVVKDIFFRKRQRIAEGAYTWQLYLGDQHLGFVTHGRIGGWSAYSNNGLHRGVKDPMRMVDGFRTRFDAAAYVIRHHGYWNPDDQP